MTAPVLTPRSQSPSGSRTVSLPGSLPGSPRAGAGSSSTGIQTGLAADAFVRTSAPTALERTPSKVLRAADTVLADTGSILGQSANLRALASAQMFSTADKYGFDLNKVSNSAPLLEALDNNHLPPRLGTFAPGFRKNLQKLQMPEYKNQTLDEEFAKDLAALKERQRADKLQTIRMLGLTNTPETRQQLVDTGMAKSLEEAEEMMKASQTPKS